MKTRSLVFLRIGSDFLEDAKPYRSRKAASEAFQRTASELARFGQSIDASVHFAESREALQEYPDFVLSLGPRGGVKWEAA